MYIIPVIVVFCLVMLTVVARLEKRMVWPYGDPEAGPQVKDTSDYAARWVGAAMEAGYSFLGWAPDLKGSHMQVSYAFLVSPERDCVAIIGVGAVAAIPVRGTWLYTAASDGRVVYSTDNQSGIEIDVSRHWRNQLVRADSFPALVERHRSMLRRDRIIPRLFDAGRALEEFKQLRKEHFQTLSRQGWIAFTDGSATHWRYTLVGAMKYAALNYSIGLVRAVTFGRIPRSA